MGFTNNIASHTLKRLLLLIAIGLVKSSFAQQVPVSQYYVSPILINPALAGSSSHPLVTVHHRSQWSAYANAYPINIASVIYPIIQEYPRRINKGGLGLMCSHEAAGAQGWLTNTELRVAGAYNLPLDYQQHHIISLGVSTSYQQRSIDPGKIQWGSQYDDEQGYVSSIVPSVNVLRQRVGYVSVQAGAVWSYNTFKNQLLNPWQWSGGVAIAHMNQPNISFIDQAQPLPLLIKGHGGISYTKNNWKIHPQVMVLKQQSSYHVNVGAYYQYRVGYYDQQQNTVLLGGLWYRWNDAIAASAGLKHRNIQLAFSVDFSQYPSIDYVSSGQAWEASIVYTIVHRKEIMKRRSTPLI
ncbi:MAG: PorP/SprF family type IX secretion system membrane protein [Cyclobacteriaceae bacterium]